MLALATSFEKLAKLSDASTNKLMSSHSDSEKRAKRVRDQAEKDGLLKE